MLISINKHNFNNLNNQVSIDGEQYSYQVIGDLYLENAEETISKVVKNRTEELSKLITDFTVIILNHSTSEVIIFSDRPGKQNVFFSVINEQILIADDLWQLKSELNLGIEDLDVESIKQQIVFFTGLDSTTIFKCIKTVPAATIISINQNNYSVSKKRYWQFQFDKHQYSREDKLDLIDNTFDQALNTVKQLNPNEKSFAVGVSGGLDSRLIPYYAQKNGMDIEGFTIGLEKPNKLFLSNDFNSANKIAAHFNIERKTLNYNSLSFKEQIELESQLAPETGSQLFKVVDPSVIKSRVLITGASGFVVGASPMYSSILDNDLMEHTLLYQSLLTSKPSGSRYKKAVNHFTGLKLKFTPEVGYDGLGTFFSESDVDKAMSSIKGFYDEFNGLSKTEMLMNYAIFGLGRNNAKGAFESFLGQMKSYSIYTPFFLDTVATFSESELLNRKLFQEFFVERLPELSQMQGQEYRPTLSHKRNALLEFSRKVSAMGNFVIRGSGVMNYENWTKSSEFMQLKNEMNEKSADILSQLGISFDTGNKNVHPAIKQNILKMQNILLKV